MGCYSKYRRFDDMKLKWLPPQIGRGRFFPIFQLYIVVALFRMVHNSGKSILIWHLIDGVVSLTFLTNFGIFEKWRRHSSIFSKNVWFHPKWLHWMSWFLLGTLGWIGEGSTWITRNFKGWRVQSQNLYSVISTSMISSLVSFSILK